MNWHERAQDKWMERKEKLIETLAERNQLDEQEVRSDDQLSPENQKAADRLARDEILIDEGLLVADPTAQIGLITGKIPDVLEVIEPVNSYNTRSTIKRKVSCSRCGRSKNHNRGMTVRLSDGSLALSGIDCCEDDFGKGVWQTHLNELNRRQDLAVYSARISPLIQEIAALQGLLVQWLPDLKSIESVYLKFEAELPELFGALVSLAAKDENELTRTKTIRTTKVDRQGKEHEVSESIEERYGSLPSKTFLRNRRMSSELMKCHHKLREIVDDLQKAKKNQLLQELRRQFKIYDLCIDELKSVTSAHTSAHDLIDRNVRRRISNWGSADTHTDGKYKETRLGFSARFRGCDPVRVEFPPTFPPLPPGLKRALQKAFDTENLRSTSSK